MIFCEQCGFKVQDSWKHCPKCSHKVSIPTKAKPAEAKVEVKLPDDWDPLFTSSQVMQEEFIRAGLATSGITEADKEWEDQWIAAFNGDTYRPVFGDEYGGTEAPYIIHLGTSFETLTAALDQTDTKVDQVTVKVIDDGWSAEIEFEDNDFLKAEELAKDIQAQFGGEVVVVKPKANKSKSTK